MSTTTNMVGERVCVVFSYNTRFSCLCHAVRTPLCTNLLSVHAHVVAFLCVERTQSDITRGECERHVCSLGILLLENTFIEPLISQATTGLLFWQNELEGKIIFRAGKGTGWGRQREFCSERGAQMWGKWKPKQKQKKKSERKWISGRSGARCGKWCSSALLWMEMEVFERLLHSPIGTQVTPKTRIRISFALRVPQQNVPLPFDRKLHLALFQLCIIYQRCDS